MSWIIEAIFHVLIEGLLSLFGVPEEKREKLLTYAGLGLVIVFGLVILGSIWFFQ